MDILREKRSSCSMLFGSSSACRVDFESVKITMLEGDFSLCSKMISDILLLI